MTRLAYVGAASAALMMMVLAAPARPAVTVYADNAQDCYRAAKYGDIRGTGLDDCDDASSGASSKMIVISVYWMRVSQFFVWP